MEQHPIEYLCPMSNNVVIWIDVTLFTSPFFRESYCCNPLWNSSRSKNCILVGRKTHGL